MTPLPANWQSTTSDELCEFITSGSRDWRSFYSDKGAVFVRTQDIKQDRLDLSGAARVDLPPNVEGKRSLLRPGDLLITITGANVGKVALVPEDIPEAYVSQSVGLMRLKDKRLAPFLHYYLQCSAAGRKHVLDMVYGIGRPVLSLQNLRSIPIVLPPIAEQCRILERIEELLSDLDAGVAALERARVRLAHYRASVLRAAVEGTLTTEWRLQHPRTEPASELLKRILAERRRHWEEMHFSKFKEKGQEPPKHWKQKYQEPIPPQTEDLSPLPEGWSWASLDQIGNLDRGRSRNRPRDAAFLYGGAYPFIQTGDVRKARQYLTEHLQTYSEQGLEQSRLWPAETLCITIAANIAETAILSYPACFPDSVVGVVFDPSLICVRYVELFIRSAKNRISAYAPATAQKNINNEILRSLAVPLPPLDEQQAIVDWVEDQMSVVDHTGDDIDVTRRNSCALRQAILRHAITGQLVAQDPDDEPRGHSDGHFPNR